MKLTVQHKNKSEENYLKRNYFSVDFKCSYTHDYIATLSRSPVYALHSVAVCAIQCKVVVCFRARLLKRLM